MEQIIAQLLQDFENGRLTRRQLIQRLALGATAASAIGVAPAAAAGGETFKAVAVNHISYQVADYTKTRDFYAGLLGMKATQDNGSQCYLTFGDHGSWLLARNARAGQRDAESRPHRLHHRVVGQGQGQGRARPPRSQPEGRHREQLPREGSRRVRPADQRERDEAVVARRWAATTLPVRFRPDVTTRLAAVMVGPEARRDRVRQSGRSRRMTTRTRATFRSRWCQVVWNGRNEL